MATVKMCDACGSIIFENERFETRMYGRCVCGIHTFNSARKIDRSFDLCDDCLEILFTWLGCELDDQR